MASLEFDKISESFHIRFRYAGRSFKRSLKTADRRMGRATVARVDEMLMLIESGRLNVPADADPVEFILSDGKRTETVPVAKPLTLGQLFLTFKKQRLPGDKELNTIKTEDLHIRHLARVLKQSTFIQTLKTHDLQQYVVERLEGNRVYRPVVAETIRKELATLRVVWNWALRQEFINRPAPVAGLQYPKRDQRHPFRTWDEIMAILARGSVSKEEERELWESLYLTREEIHEALKFAKSVAKHAFIYPLLLLVAHTGVRVSEALRSRIEDIDFNAGSIMIREKKRSRVRATTFRRINMTPLLAETLKEWLVVHPGTLFTFAKEQDLNRGRVSPGIVSINKHVARKHFKLTFRGSKWSRLRGYHIFRHAFASNLAAAGVDQRIIDEWMGHQTEEMRQRYRHLLPQTARAAILKLMPGA